jgi:hypothetical protein
LTFIYSFEVCFFATFCWAGGFFKLVSSSTNLAISFYLSLLDVVFDFTSPPPFVAMSFSVFFAISLKEKHVFSTSLCN